MLVYTAETCFDMMRLIKKLVLTPTVNASVNITGVNTCDVVLTYPDSSGYIIHTNVWQYQDLVAAVKEIQF